ncbi:MAG: hypothetical protein K6E40_11110 [Desulfovibrio sp.]|nr:hypothetical protein [Desulfovibrio sp.]
MPDEDPTLTPGDGENTENTGTENTGDDDCSGIDASSGSGSSSPEDFLAQLRAAKKARMRSGLASGPSYQGSRPAPIVWYDQIFEAGATPSGAVDCGTALRVGSTQNQLDVVIVASHGNAGDLSCPGGGTVSVALYQSDSAEGEFEACGPVIAATLPADGMSVEPDGLVVRIPVGNMTKPWLKPSVTFTGVFSGGTVDVALSFMPR